MNKKFLASVALFLVVVTLTSCKNGEQPDGEVTVDTPPVIGRDVVTQAMPSGEDFTHPEYGEETMFAYGAMAGTGEEPANGVSTLQVFEDGASVLRLNLNIRQASDGSFYVAWLKNAEGRMVNVGRLETPFNDVRHSVGFEVNDDLSGFLTAIVTRETTESPALPGTTVAEGTMKVTPR